MPRTRPWSAFAAVATGATAFACISAGAHAGITPYPRNASAMPLARAIERTPGLVRRADFSVLPPRARSAAVSTTRLAGFPRRGSSFAILSSGNARLADDPNDSPDSGSSSGGPRIRGARDVLIVRFHLRVPEGANCLSFNFRFLSEEFPEFVNDDFNDAFIAELGDSTWDAGSETNPTITAPRNFAVDRKGNPIRVNAIGDTTVRARYAKGTTYDGATRLLRASTPVKPGREILYLSIFDQGDRIFDSAVFVDDLRAEHRKTCTSGVARQR
jgi:hypothetical protein